MNGVRDFGRRANGTNSKIEDALHGDFDAANKLTQERPHHRRFLDLTIQGFNHKEIADLTGFSTMTVANCLKQTWAREYLIKHSKRTVQEEMKQFLEEQVLPSLETLRAVRDSEKVRASDRITASNSLLDRFLGKPVQPISENTKTVSEMSEEEVDKALSEHGTN